MNYSSDHWTADDIDFLLGNYIALGKTRCAEMLGRTTKATTCKYNRLHAMQRGEAPKKATPSLYGEHSVGYQRKPSTITTRRCTDCKRPTTDFRCPACWEKRRTKYRDSCDGPTAEEVYGVMA